MSQISSLRDTMLEWQVKYKWTVDETVENFTTIMDNMGGSLVISEPVKDDGSIDYDEMEEMEEMEARKLLFGR